MDKLARCFAHTLRPSVTVDHACAGVAVKDRGPSGWLGPSRTAVQEVPFFTAEGIIARSLATDTPSTT